MRGRDVLRTEGFGGIFSFTGGGGGGISDDELVVVVVAVEEEVLPVPEGAVAAWLVLLLEVVVAVVVVEVFVLELVSDLTFASGAGEIKLALPSLGDDSLDIWMAALSLFFLLKLSTR